MKLSTKVRSEWIERCAKAMDGGRASGSTEPQREPVKFEAGQVVRVVMHDRGRVTGDTAKVVVKTTLSTFWCADMRNLLYLHHYFVDSDCHNYALVSPAPRAGDTWSNGESVARIELCTRGGASLRIVSEGEPFIGDVVTVARRLWEGGYRRVDRASGTAAQGRAQEYLDGLRDQVRAAFAGEPPRLGVASAADVQRMYEALRKVDEQLSARLKARFAQSRIDAMTPQSVLDGIAGDCTWTPVMDDRVPHAGHMALDSTRVDRATGDDLRKLAEVHGVPELREGMALVDARDRARPRFGRIDGVYRDTGWVTIVWLGTNEPDPYGLDNAVDSISAGRWRIVDPDVRPLASLANAVAAIFTRPDLATSRCFIDQAIASLRGEPFAAAVAATLVAAGDRPMSPHQIAALVRGARAHESRRGEVAPARRTLTDDQMRACWSAAYEVSGGHWGNCYSVVYERARSA